MGEARVHVIMSGLVEGMFIKSAVKTKAALLGVKGWIRNTSGGELETILEGDKERLQQMVDFLRQGPNGAVIYNFDAKWGEATGEFREFEVKPKSDFRVAINTKDIKKNQ
jgi:acylphosphatase